MEGILPPLTTNLRGPSSLTTSLRGARHWPPVWGNTTYFTVWISLTIIFYVWISLSNYPTFVPIVLSSASTEPHHSPSLASACPCSTWCNKHWDAFISVGPVACHLRLYKRCSDLCLGASRSLPHSVQSNWTSLKEVINLWNVGLLWCW